MSELLPFCKIKLQYLLEMVTDHELDDNALRVALYLALAHADHETGESRPSFETIGAAIGKHAKSVKRALNKVEAAGYMTVERGTNKGKSSRYRPTEAALRRATERRRCLLAPTHIHPWWVGAMPKRRAQDAAPAAPEQRCARPLLCCNPALTCPHAPIHAHTLRPACCAAPLVVRLLHCKPSPAKRQLVP